MLSELTLNSSVGQWVATEPGLARFFERLGIDYCCGGKKPLSEALCGLGLDPETVLTLLTAVDTLYPVSQQDHHLNGLSLSQQVDHIVQTHHAYMDEALPRLSALVEKVAQAHGEKDARLPEVRRIFQHLRLELDIHLRKEEQVLFPYCKALEASDSLPPCHCGSVGNPIRVMEREHTDAGEALAALRRLTDNYTAPEWACNTYRVLLSGLAEMEADLHQHIHEENNILFPQALAMAEARGPLAPPPCASAAYP
jgi:regulator of cell morphogenesis and NO signaling